MRIKTKLYLGIGLLLTMIIFLAFITIRQINLLALASDNILKDNKETIAFTQSMLKALSEIDHNKDAINTFENYLAKQKSNITETGEKELTEKLAANFQLLKENPKDKLALVNVQTCLHQIMDINLKAIDSKNTVAAITAKESIFLISILSFFCIIIALILFVKLPGNISNPIKELTKSIRHIAANDYSQKVTFEGHSELGELAVSFNKMAMKLDEYNRSNVSKLLAEKKITETLINKIQYPIITLDKNLKITMINEEFSKFSGLKSNDIIGKQILELAQDNDLVKQLVIMGTEKPNQMALEESGNKIRIAKNGKDIYFEKEIREIYYTSPAEKEPLLMGYVIILKNITKFVDLDLEKTKFIATISHELKTPISAIKFGLQLLENEKTGPLNNEQRDLIKSCEEDTRVLLKIISELLNITQIETGNIQLNMMPASVSEILQYAMNTNRHQAERKGISFEVDCNDNLPEALVDKEKTTWVLTNIISNAIQYSHDHSKIFICAFNFENRIKIMIQDTGQGIEPQYKEKIFDRYFRVPGTNIEGSGLGLAISKEFIEAQGGKISVDSEWGIGSKFTITLNCKV